MYGLLVSLYFNGAVFFNVTSILEEVNTETMSDRRR